MPVSLVTRWYALLDSMRCVDFFRYQILLHRESLRDSACNSHAHLSLSISKMDWTWWQLHRILPMQIILLQLKNLTSRPQCKISSRILPGIFGIDVVCIGIGGSERWANTHSKAALIRPLLWSPCLKLLTVSTLLLLSEQWFLLHTQE